MSMFATPSSKKRPRYSILPRDTPITTISQTKQRPSISIVPPHSFDVSFTPNKQTIQQSINDALAPSPLDAALALLNQAEQSVPKIDPQISALQEQLHELRTQHTKEFNEWRKAEVDRQEGLIQEIAELRERLSLAQESEAKRQLFEEDNERLQHERIAAKQDRINELEQKMVYFTDIENSRREEIEQKRIADERQQEIIDAERETARNELAEARARLALLEKRDTLAEERLQIAQSANAAELEFFKAQVSELETELSVERQKSLDLANQIQSLEQLEQQRLQDENDRAEREQQMAEVSESLSLRLQRASAVEQQYRDAIAEIKSLNEQLARSELLKDQINDLNAKVERLQKENTQLIEQDVELKSVKEAIQSIAQSPLAVNPSQLRQALYRLDEEKQQLVAQTSSDRQIISSLQQQLQDMQSRLTQLSDQLTTDQAALLQSRTEVIVMNEQIATAHRERDSLQRLLNSYTEDAVNAGAASSAQIAELTNELNTLRGHHEQAMNRLSSMIQLQAENERLTRSLAEAQAVANNLRAQPNANDDVGSKILHFSDNPLIQSQRTRLLVTIDELKNEITDLKARLVAAVQSASSSNQSDTHVDVHASDRVAELERDIRLAKERYDALSDEAGKRYDRLKKVFAEKVKEFREGCYELTGFKIEVLGETWRLKPMHAAGEADCVLFKRKNGTFSLLENEFIASLSPETTDALHVWRSIPVFLAALTTELASKQTRIV